MITTTNINEKNYRVVFIVTDSSNYYQEPVTVRIFSTKEKAISFCDKKDPNRKYLDWEEFEVE